MRASRLKRRRPERTKPISNDRKPLRLFHEWLRGFPCFIADHWCERMTAGGLVHHHHVCRGKIQVAHIRIGTNGGTGLKPSDFYALPLCEGAHMDEQHRWGERTFYARYGIDAHKEAAVLFGRWQKEAAAGKRYALAQRQKEPA